MRLLCRPSLARLRARLLAWTAAALLAALLLLWRVAMLDPSRPAASAFDLRHWSLAAIARAFGEVPLTAGLLNSALLCLLAVPASLAAASAAGFALTPLSARLRALSVTPLLRCA